MYYLHSFQKQQAKILTQMMMRLLPAYSLLDNAPNSCTHSAHVICRVLKSSNVIAGNICLCVWSKNMHFLMWLEASQNTYLGKPFLMVRDDDASSIVPTHTSAVPYHSNENCNYNYLVIMRTIMCQSPKYENGSGDFDL